AAVRDLDAILDYSDREHGEATAEAYLRAIGDALVRLTDFPELGGPREDVRPMLRALPCGEHRIFYRYDGRTVSIVRVLHRAMDAERWLG
ncbi:MAG TPA: type II toxin-antitoxin system RelE/ParE family toxin, partial [Allosphingosinicella sp.]|nr:type II toxin-antitoxin system RelE/ParE family toxin [Allosphingosinicella sp.]